MTKMINSNYFIISFLVSLILQTVVTQYFIRKIMGVGSNITGYEDIMYFGVSTLFFLGTILTSIVIAWAFFKYKNND